MKMIVGLGNPGDKYAKTKHNIGFMAIDALAKKYDVTLNKHEFQAAYGSFIHDGEKIFLVKPLTYMNDSGRAVGPLMGYYQLQNDELIVIQDDMDLPIGKVRLRQKGSAGGHNGIKSIINVLGTQQFNRIKIGIQHPQRQKVVDWVLTPFSTEGQIEIDNALDKASDAVDDWITNNDYMNTMNRYN